jgi:predicted DNA binding CopG/RHH family protein
MKIYFQIRADDRLPTLNRNRRRNSMPMTTRTTVRWADREFEEVRRYASQRGIPLSAAIREVLLKHVPQPQQQPDFWPNP